MHGLRKRQNISPETSSSIVSQIFFCWLVRLLNLGTKKKLLFSDIYTCNDEDLSQPLGDTLEKNWNKEMEQSAKKNKKPSLSKAIIRAYFSSYMGCGILIFIQCVVIKMVQPLVMYRLLKYFMDPDQVGIVFGYTKAIVFLVIAFFYIFLYQHTMLGCHRLGTRVKTACASLIYRKLLRLSLHTIATSKLKFELNVLLTKEINKLEKASLFLHFLWITPIQTCLVLYFMFCLGGYFSTVGCGTVFLFVILSSAPLIMYNEKYENQIKALSTKQRTQMKDIVKNITTVKMFACEDMVNELIFKLREKQRRINHKRSYLFGLTSGIIYYSARLGIFATVMSYLLADTLFTTQLMYTIIQFLNLVEVQMAVLLPMSIKCYIELQGVLKRIKIILLLPEMSLQTQTIHGNPGYIKITNLTAGWSLKGKTHNLMNVNLELKPGNVYAITGPRQSGKSSLVLSILNEVPIINGKVEVCGRISYASQEPWIFDSSIKYNIILEKRFQKSKYAFIMKVCGINVDLHNSRYGDQSIVNEHIFLDSSQQARLNMARAAYNSADIYIFDECFEPMKVAIAQKLYKGCIKRYLRPTKTVLLVTSQIDILKMADYVIVVKDSKVTMSPYVDIPAEELAKYRWLRTALDGNRKTNIELQANNRKLIAGGLQDTEKGHVSVRDLFNYMKNYSNRSMKCVFFFFIVLTQVAVNGGDFTLMLWASVSEKCLVDAADGNYSGKVKIFNFPLKQFIRSTDNDTHIGKADCFSDSSIGMASYFTVYTILAITTFVFVGYSIYLYCQIRHKVHKDFHDSAFNTILRADMQYFYENSTTSVVQTLVNDINVVEGPLPDRLWDILIIMSICIGMVVTICVFVPVAIPLVLLIGFLLYRLHMFFTATTNDIAIIVSDTSSSLFRHILETISGLVTIRSNNSQKMTTKEFHHLFDDHSASASIMMIIWRMYSLYIDFFFTIFLAFMIVQFFFMPDILPYIVSSIVGMVITDCYYFIGFVQYGLKQMNKISLDLYSVQNIMSLKKIPQEKVIDKADKEYSDSWPSSGSIRFNNLTVVSPNLEDKLYDFDLVIESGKKVAVLGEPGSGQYCLIYAIFRLCEYSGTIEIDDEDISTIDLQDLRRHVSILTGEPMVFSTTLRNNLNYHGFSTTERLQEIMKIVGMELNLDKEVDNKDFSLEDKQLINLMRILAKENKIVILEESEIKLDKEVENHVNQIIVQEMRNATIINMTNNLPKIFDYDYCVFLEKGRVVKEGVPRTLINNKDEHVMKYLDLLSPEELAHFRETFPSTSPSNIKNKAAKTANLDDEID